MTSVVCTFLVTSIFAQGAALPTSSTTSPPPSAPSQGTRIGTIISEAIGVALPNVTKLITAIFGSNNKADKVTATTQLDTQAKAAKQDSDAKLAQLASVAVELNVVSEYLEQTVPTSQRISRLLAKLDDAHAGTIPTGAKSDWDEIGKSLQKLGDIKNSELNSVQPGLRLRLVEIRNAYDANRDDIQSSLDKPDTGSLKAQLRAIQALLNSVVAIAGIEISDLQSDLSSVVAKASKLTPQGAPSQERINAFWDLSGDELSLARTVLTKGSQH